MYPETDLPILKISKQIIDEAKRTLPKVRSDIEKEIKKQGLSEEYVKLLFKQNKLNEYKEAYFQFPKPNLIANLILVFPKDLARKKNKNYEEVSEIIGDNLLDVLNLVNSKKIKEEDIKFILENIVDGKSLEEAIKIEKIEISAIEEKIHDLIKSKPGLNSNAYMGLVMKELRGKIGGNEAMEIIKKLLKK